MKIPYFGGRFAAWAWLIGLAIASWTPDDEMIRTGFDARLEHIAAYMIAGIAVLVAYPRKAPWSVAVFLSAYAGVLELGQIYVPGRHATVLDWLIGWFRRGGLRLRRVSFLSEPNAQRRLERTVCISVVRLFNCR